jgi:hypothetical protein
MLLQIIFLETIRLSEFFSNLGRCQYIYAYWLQFKDFFEIMLLVEPKFTEDAYHPSSIKKLKKNIN